jgi:hypothetical protein
MPLTVPITYGEFGESCGQCDIGIGDILYLIEFDQLCGILIEDDL